MGLKEENRDLNEKRITLEADNFRLQEILDAANKCIEEHVKTIERLEQDNETMQCKIDELTRKLTEASVTVMVPQGWEPVVVPTRSLPYKGRS